MNRLLAAIQKSRQPSMQALRTLYRKLAVKWHPDSSQGSAEEFVRLQSEYDEALAYMLAHRPRMVERRPKPASPREAFLRALYLYAVAYGNKNWRERLPPLIALASEYKRDVGTLFVDYGDVLLRKLDGADYMTFLVKTHELVLSSIKTLAWFYETGLEWDRRMLQSYLGELSQRAGSLDRGLREITLGLCKLVRDEAESPPLSLLTIGVTEVTPRRR